MANKKLPTRAKELAISEKDPEFMFKVGFLDDVYNEVKTKPIMTRFPPEPNGFLHIGHAKAVAINFGFARYHGGECYLRFDDTNPEAEEEVYFNAITDAVKWLGFRPCKITYSSDHFDELYELAEKLIKSGNAYVCKCTDEEVKRYRGGPKSTKREECPHRNRPIEESLADFRGMKEGKFKPGEATLRMKMDLTSGNPQMWDLIAYRVLNKPHHRTGDKWRIYPTYDYTHCLCDSFEHISHSLCTTEFETSRVSYDWLLEKLGMVDPKPEQREYGRLNMDGTITSKRKINELVSKNIVRAWDDPRLYTLLALRRRGIPPGAILSFVNSLGVSKNLTSINVVVFDNSVRKYLEMTAPRLMLVLDPVLVILDNVPDDYLKPVELSFGPKDVDMGKHVVPFTKSIYIEREDFREEGSDLFYRLSPGKMVALLNGTSKPFVIKATSFKKEESGSVTEIHAELMKPEEVTKKSYKASIHWVGKSAEHHSPIELAEVRLFNPLFKSKDPNSAEGGYLADIREGSEEIYSNAVIEIGLEEIRKRAPWPAEAGEKVRLDDEEGEEKIEPIKPAPETVRFQGMRNAYFCLDSDTVDDKIILNRIVSLKEDKGKDA
jgi:glutaminyl-tRNA synthetase